MKENLKSIKKQVIKLRDKMEDLDIMGCVPYLDSVLEELEACEEELEEYYLED